MYAKYAESKGWKVEVTDSEDSEAGGFSLITFKVTGQNAYGTLKFESGSHRVQRVPKTESQGRIQTSTATVLCYPELDEEDFDIDMNDLEIETMRASQALEDSMLIRPILQFVSCINQQGSWLNVRTDALNMKIERQR